MSNLFKTSFLIVIIFLWVICAVAADTLTGTVRNQTTGKPAVGDEVVLLRLGEGMQQEARTKTDAQGAFTLKVAFPNDRHIVQVSHQGVNYDQSVNGPGPVEISVYDAVANIPELRGTIGVTQLESEGTMLKVTERYEIANTSNPPVTQSRADNFKITVPPKAVFDSVEARRGLGMWLKVTPEPVKSSSGEYTINFPIRPGRTQLNLAYHVPYTEAMTLHLRVPYPIERFGILHPSSMKFKPSRPELFQSSAMSAVLQGEVLTRPVVGDVPAFQISGVGTAPQHGTEAASAPAPPTVSTPSVNPRASQSNPPSAAERSRNEAADQSRKELGLMIAGIFVILAVGVFTLWRMNNKRVPEIVSAKPGAGKPLLDALKEELFQLESDRLHGSISAEEYATSKQALNKSIERAMGK
jgi:hypothetical protein